MGVYLIIIKEGIVIMNKGELGVIVELIIFQDSVQKSYENSWFDLVVQDHDFVEKIVINEVAKDFNVEIVLIEDDFGEIVDKICCIVIQEN